MRSFGQEVGFLCYDSSILFGVSRWQDGKVDASSMISQTNADVGCKSPAICIFSLLVFPSSIHSRFFSDCWLYVERYACNEVM